MAVKKYVSADSLKHFLEKLKELFVKKTDVATVDTAGLVRPDGSTILVTEEGVVSAKSSGGGSVPFAMEVGGDGHLYVYYEDSQSEPSLSIDDDGHLYWTYETED